LWAFLVTEPGLGAIEMEARAVALAQEYIEELER